MTKKKDILNIVYIYTFHLMSGWLKYKETLNIMDIESLFRLLIVQVNST